jgi:uncharacterized protein (TIGR03066 family)
MKTKSKKPKQVNQRSTPAVLLANRSSGFRRLLLGLTVVVVAAGVWALFEFVIWNRLPAELVGTWEVQGGPQDGAVFDFHRNGSLVAKVNDGGMVGTTYATIRVEGNKLYSTSKRPSTGEATTSVMLIHTLTADEFVVEDSQNKIWRMKRTNLVIR